MYPESQDLQEGIKYTTSLFSKLIQCENSKKQSVKCDFKFFYTKKKLKLDFYSKFDFTLNKSVIYYSVKLLSTLYNVASSIKKGKNPFHIKMFNFDTVSI